MGATQEVFSVLGYSRIVQEIIQDRPVRKNPYSYYNKNKDKPKPTHESLGQTLAQYLNAECCGEFDDDFPISKLTQISKADSISTQPELRTRWFEFFDNLSPTERSVLSKTINLAATRVIQNIGQIRYGNTNTQRELLRAVGPRAAAFLTTLFQKTNPQLGL